MSSTNETDELSSGVGGIEDDRGRNSTLVFRAGALWLGIPSHYVEQLHAPPQMTPMPLAPDYVSGLAIFRGEVVPLLDIERFLKLEEPEEKLRESTSRGRSSTFKRVAVVFADGMHVGIMCSEVRGIVSVEPPADSGVAVARGRRLERIAAFEVSTKDGILVVVDVPKLLEEARVKP